MAQLKDSLITGDLRVTGTIYGDANLGSLNANGTGLGTNGQILKSTGTGIAWADANISGNAATANKLSTDGTTAQFWRGDNTWSDTIYGGLLKITNHSTTLSIGAQNTSWVHFTNTAGRSYYFDKDINATTGFRVYNTTTSLTNNNLTFSQGGGWYMQDTTWIRTVGSKSVYQNSGILRTDGTLQVGSEGNYLNVNSSGIKLGSATATSNAANLVTVNGHIVINAAKNTSNSYSEGLRINNGSNNWTTIAIGGDDTSTSGTGQAVWLIGANRHDTTNKVSNFYISSNGSNTATMRITGHRANNTETGWSIRPRLGIGADPSTDYLLYVNGASGITNRLTMVSGKPINQILTGSGSAGGRADAGASADPRYTFTPSKWTFNTGLTATNGDIFVIKIPAAGHSYGVYMSIDNGSHYYPVVHQSTSRVTTHFGSGYIIAVIFDSAGSAADMVALNGATGNTTTAPTATVSGGVFRVLNYYDSNTTYTITSVWCGTAAATAAKASSNANYYALRQYNYFELTLRYANTAKSALTLNVNNTGAKPIYINGTASSASNYTLPAGKYLVYYDGTNYYFRTDNYITGNITGNAISVGSGSHAAVVNANEFNIPVGSATVVGNVSNTSMIHTNNANAEMIIKTHPSSGTNYYEARLGFSSNGLLYYMPVNTTSWKTVAYTDSNITGTAANVTGIVNVANGGTGTNTLESGKLLIGNGTDAVGVRTIKNMTTKGNLGWTAAATDIYIPTVNTLAYWDGKYNASNSNLAYCNKGAFGTLATKSSIGDHTYTPAGTIALSNENTTATVSAASSGTTTYTPGGSVSVSTNATTNKTATVSAASSGTATYTPAGTIIVSGTTSTATVVGTVTFNQVITTAEVANEVLTISAGAAGSSANQAGVLTGNPTYTFSGTPVRLVTGNIAVPNTYTATFSGTPVRLVTGNISRPTSATFTGTPATLTHSVS